MNKKIITLLFVATVCTAAHAFKTKGDGTTYSLATLCSQEEAGISCSTAIGHPTYILTLNDTIAEGDKFVMDDGVDVQFGANVTFVIEGEADFRLTIGSVFEPGTDDRPLGAALRIKSKTTIEMENCFFNYVGLELMGEGATNIRHCRFNRHDGSSAAALYFISAGAASTIEDCDFIECQKAAIGSAANASQPLTIKNCTLIRNSAANGNIPQINVTASDKLVIEGCTVTGNPENTMVGGIGISNFMGYDADVLISGCTIEDNRYGIGLVGPANHIRIENCTLLNNCHETNPMNGGSGISLYDPYGMTNAYISGNHIENSLWGVTIIGCKAVNLGCLDKSDDYNPGGNTFKDNGNNGQLYDLYNNSTLTVYAQGNTWNVSEQTEEQIETVIYHKHDDASLGEVIFWPAAGTEAVSTLSKPSADTPAYDLSGRRIGTNQRGLRIQHGKKIVR